MAITHSKLYNYCLLLYIGSILIAPSTGNFIVKVARVILVLVGIIIILVTKKIELKNNSYILWGSIFLFYCTIGVKFSYSREHAIKGLSTLLYVVVINIIIYYMISIKITKISFLIKILIWSSIISNIYIYTNNGFNVFLISRSTASGVNANIFGAHSAISIVLIFYLLCNKLVHNKYVYKFLIIASVIFMFLSGSRKVYLYVIIPIGIYYILNSKNVIILFRNIIIIFLAVFAVYYLFINIPILYNNVGYRILDMVDGFLGSQTDASTKTRLYLIELGMTWFKEKPWTGYGLGNFVALLSVVRPDFEAYYAHNNYVELLVSCGLLGTIIYYTIYIQILIKGIKLLNKKNVGQIGISIGIVISFLACEMGQVSYYNPFLQLILVICIAIISQEKESIYIRKNKYIYKT